VSPRSALLFLVAAVLWGIPYLLVELTVGVVSPAFVVFARAALGACVLVPLVLRGGRLRALRGRTRQVLWLALLDLAAPALLITVGLAAVPSSLAGTLVASVPIMVAVLAVRFAPGERVTGWRLAGLVVGLCGVGLLLGAEVAGDARALAGGLLVLAGALCYAGGALYFQRRFTDLPPLVVVAGTLVGCAVLTAVPAALDPPQALPSATVLGALVVLGAGCTGVGYSAFYALVADLGAARASVVTYLAPAVAVVGGVVLLDEPLTAGIVAGLLLVLTGAWLSSGRRPPPAPAGGHLAPAAQPPRGRPPTSAAATPSAT
jgi:drug/metabolite transporter (DMT)-like permease